MKLFFGLFLLVGGAVKAQVTVPSVKLPQDMGGGVMMPIVGIGTGGYGSNFRNHAYQFVLEFLKLGGRRIDTAVSYGDQDDIGRAVRDSKIDRSEIFITSKMPCGSYNQAKSNMDKILSQLKMDYVDLLLIHFPSNKQHNADTWRALVEFQKAGKAKAVGVSNFCVPDMEALLTDGIPKPSVNQFEFQPYWWPTKLMAYMKKEGIQVNGAAPMGGPDVAPARDHWNCSVPELPVITNMAKKHSCTPGQIILSWEFLHNDVLVNPRTNHTQHMKDNLGVSKTWWEDCKISDDEAAILSDMKNHLPAGATTGKVYHAGLCD